MRKATRAAALALVLALLSAGALAETFTTDYQGIEAAAQSVLMLSWEDTFYSYSGSAFAAFEEDMLLTNYHVIDGAKDKVYAYTDGGDKHIIDRIYIGDEDLDLALVGLSEPAGIQPLALGDTDGLLRAEPVVAIGSPKGQKNTVSLGNVSGIFQEYGVHYVQFTAPISAGSSGGALFDDEGLVIGVTSASFVDAQNINLAVDISEAKALYDRIEYKDGLSFEDYWAAERQANKEKEAQTYSAFAGRNFVAEDVRLFWCERGRNVSFLATEKTGFAGGALEDFRESLSGRDYYASLILSMDAAEADTRVDAVLELAAPNGASERLDEELRFISGARSGAALTTKITSLMGLVKGGGTYRLSYKVEGEEIAFAEFEIEGEPAPEEERTAAGAHGNFSGRLPSAPKATPEPTARPSSGELRALEKGDRGDEVRRLQQALIDLDYLEGPADGVYGDQTEQAVRAFQRVNALRGVFYGVADLRTLELLYSGEALPYADPEVVLAVDEDKEANWKDTAAGSSLSLPLVNTGRRRVVVGYTVRVRVYDLSDKLESEEALEIAQELAPGAAAYSEPLYYRETRRSSWMDVAIVSVTYADGETVEIDRPTVLEWWL